MQTDAIRETNFNFPGQTSYYEGKVREVYGINNELLVIVTATDLPKIANSISD